MSAMSMYTTLSKENQIEIILSELPNEIANMFIVEDKLNCTKAEILEFCDMIQELCEGQNPENSIPTNNPVLPSNVIQ